VEQIAMQTNGLLFYEAPLEILEAELRSLSEFGVSDLAIQGIKYYHLEQIFPQLTPENRDAYLQKYASTIRTKMISLGVSVKDHAQSVCTLTEGDQAGVLKERGLALLINGRGRTGGIQPLGSGKELDQSTWLDYCSVQRVAASHLWIMDKTLDVTVDWEGKASLCSSGRLPIGNVLEASLEELLAKAAVNPWYRNYFEYFADDARPPITEEHLYLPCRVCLERG